MYSKSLTAHAQPMGSSQVSRNIYGPVNVSGGSLHQGDIININHDDSVQRQAERFCNSLRFPDMNLRVNSIAVSHEDTFKWALENPNDGGNLLHRGGGLRSYDDFARWLTSESSIFWVAGKPGSGKSTLMKFLASNPKSVSLLGQQRNKQAIVLQHYFWLHGSEMQRSLKGCLCTLLYQVFQTDRRLSETVLCQMPDLRLKHSVNDWSEFELQNLLLFLLLESSYIFGIFLDGLDEFDKRADNRDLLNLINRLCTVSSLRLCVSSRQENIFEQAFSCQPHLRLQDLTKDDMTAMARTRLQHELSQTELCLEDDQLERIVYEVATRADGVFLWAVLIIRALAIGLQNCDSYETLLITLTQLPREMEQLFNHLFNAMSAYDPKSRAEIFSYFTLASRGEMPILIHTLVANQNLLRKISAQHPSLQAVDIGKLTQMCRITAKRVNALSAGLLEVTGVKELICMEFVRGSGEECGQDLATDSPDYRLCLCDVHYGAHGTCFRTLPDHDTLNHWHSRLVGFMHRDVVEFLRASDWIEPTDKHRKALEKDTMKSSLIAKLLCFNLGCCCHWDLADENLEYLIGSLGFLGMDEAAVMVSNMLVRSESRIRHLKEYACPYGWSHQLFSLRDQALLSVVGAPLLSLSSDLRSLTDGILDLHGLMAAMGCIPFFVNQKSEQMSWSPYYKGYLLTCAARGLNRRPMKSLMPRVETMCWLLDHDADQTSPQIIHMPITLGIALAPRAPIVDCLCFVQRVLAINDLDLEEKLRICDSLFLRLFTDTNSEKELVVWSILMEDIKSSSVLRPDKAANFFLVCVVKTTLQKLRDFVTESITNTNTISQYARTDTVPLEAYDIIYVVAREHDNQYPLCDFYSSIYDRFDTHTAILDGRSYDARVHKSFSRVLRQVIQTSAEVCLDETDGDTNREEDDFKLNILLFRVCGEFRLGKNERAPKMLCAELYSFPNSKARSSEFPLSDKRKIRQGILNLYYSYSALPPALGLVSGLVPPNQSAEVSGSQWYEYGALREWHERRRRGLWKAPPKFKEYLEKFETDNWSIRPSYLPRTGNPTTGVGLVCSINEDDLDFSSVDQCIPSDDDSSIDVEHDSISESYESASEEYLSANEE